MLINKNLFAIYNCYINKFSHILYLLLVNTLKKTFALNSAYFSSLVHIYSYLHMTRLKTRNTILQSQVIFTSIFRLQLEERENLEYYLYSLIFTVHDKSKGENRFR